MDTLTTVPGVIQKPSRIYVTKEDVIILFGCSKSKAYDVIQNVNAHARKKGKFAMQAGKANKYLFADLYAIPLEDVNDVINQCGEV